MERPRGLNASFIAPIDLEGSRPSVFFSSSFFLSSKQTFNNTIRKDNVVLKWLLITSSQQWSVYQNNRYQFSFVLHQFVVVEGPTFASFPPPFFSFLVLIDVWIKRKKGTSLKGDWIWNCVIRLYWSRFGRDTHCASSILARLSSSICLLTAAKWCRCS